MRCRNRTLPRYFILVGILVYAEHYFTAAYDFTQDARQLFVYADSYVNACSVTKELTMRIDQLRWVAAVGYAV